MVIEVRIVGTSKGQYQLGEGRRWPTGVLELFCILALHGGYLGIYLKFYQVNNKFVHLTVSNKGRHSET